MLVPEAPSAPPARVIAPAPRLSTLASILSGRTSPTDADLGERAAVAVAIRDARGNLSEVARRLGLSRSAAGRRVVRLGLESDLDRARVEGGARRGRSGRVLPPDEEIARELAEGWSISALARRYGASRRAVQLAARRIEGAPAPARRERVARSAGPRPGPRRPPAETRVSPPASAPPPPRTAPVTLAAPARSPLSGLFATAGPIDLRSLPELAAES